MEKISTITAVFPLLFTFHMVSLIIAALIVKFDKFLLLYLTYYLMSIFLWCSLYLRRKETATLLRKIYKLRNLFHLSNKNGLLVINCILSVLHLSLGVVYTIVFYLTENEDISTHYYTFGYEVESRLLNDILIVCGISFSYILVFYIPSMASVTFSMLEYRLSEILASYNDQLKRLLENNNQENAACLIRLFLTLSGTCEELKDILSLPLMLLIASSFVGLSVNLSKVTSWTTSPLNVITTVLVLSVTCFAIFSQGIFGSLIPEKLEGICKTAGKIVEKYDKRSKKENEHLFYFKRIAKTEVTYLTASGVFRFDTGFILHAFGAIFTYGLLIINMK